MEKGGTQDECEESAFAQANGVVLKEEREMSALQRLSERVREVFADAMVTERKIKEVDTWSGAASNYADTEAYCAACLIDVNAAAGNDEKKQSHCMLPIREPGDGADTMVDKALHAAAGGHGLTQVVKPEDVPQDAWDAAVKAAANKIISGYSQMDEKAPDAIYELAGKEAPKRAISGWDMMDQVYAQLDHLDGDLAHAWPVDIYLDGGQLYMVVTSEGKLFRATIKVEESTNAVMLGEWQQIKVEHVPLENRIVVHRQADGKWRFVVIANTAILNRVGEIDSMTLFDSFIQRIEDTGQYPFVTFYHVTEPEEALAMFRLGQCDFVARDGPVYINSGLLDEKAPLGPEVIRALEKEPERWGTSIAYKPWSAPEMAEIGGVRIPVYDDGEHVELSLILEEDAAALYTAVRQEVCRMDPRIAKGLEALGLTEERISEFAKLVDGVKDRVRAEGLITRTEEGEPGPEAAPEATPEPADQTVAAAASEETPETEEVNVVLDESALPGLAAGLLDTDAFQQVLVPIVDSIKDISKKLEEAVASLAQVQTDAMAGVESRLIQLEKTDDEKRRDWEADLPAKRTIINVTHRAPGRGEDGPEGSRTYAEVAQETLDKLTHK
jgi:hypothetical protein